jgi:hypothetical protein
VARLTPHGAPQFFQSSHNLSIVSMKKIRVTVKPIENTRKPRFKKDDVSGEFSDGTQFVKDFEGSPNVYINGVYKKFPPMNCPIVFIASGELREPKAGEYFFSGGKITAWYARNDLLTKYWIAVPVEMVATTTIKYERV